MKDLWSSCLISLERATATNTTAMNEYWREYTEIENGSHDFSETKTKERIDLKWKVEIENEMFWFVFLLMKLSVNDTWTKDNDNIV